jgi:predicted phosphodiesterase
MTSGLLRQVAVLSDIHGNLWALEKILEDLDRRRIATVVNLGDCLYGPLAPAAVADILRDRDFLTVRGNEDRLLGEEAAGRGENPTLDFVKTRLSAGQRAWLRDLPETASLGGELFLCHGTPTDDAAYLLRTIRKGRTVARGHREIARDLTGVQESVILCGHDHSPGTVLLPDGRLVVNPGSVGLPAYVDDQPRLHCVENTSPHARYCVLNRDEEGWSVEHLQVAYDWKTAAEVAAANGRPDWAGWLQTGRTCQ